MMRRGTVIILLAAAAASLCAQESGPDAFAPLRFFVGTWQGDQLGQPGNGVSRRTYEFVLNNRFLEVKKHFDVFAATEKPQRRNPPRRWNDRL
jgi:hypothetical protein